MRTHNPHTNRRQHNNRSHVPDAAEITIKDGVDAHGQTPSEDPILEASADYVTDAQEVLYPIADLLQQISTYDLETYYTRQTVQAQYLASVNVTSVDELTPKQSKILKKRLNTCMKPLREQPMTSQLIEHAKTVIHTG